MTENAIAASIAKAKGDPEAELSELEIAALPRNDLGNARRLIARHGRNIINVDEAGFYTFDGKRWLPPNARVSPAATLLMQATVDAMAAETEALHGEARRYKRLILPEPLTESGELDPDEKKWEAYEKSKVAFEVAIKNWSAHGKFVISSGNAGRIEAGLRMVAPMVRRSPEDLDRDPWLFNCDSGTLEIGGPHLPTTEEIANVRPHRREDYLTHMSPIAYDPTATCPKFEAFLERMQPNKNVREFLQRAAGYSFTGDVREQKMLMLSGRGANGKSTFLDCLSHVAGSYAASVPVETFLHDDRRRGGEATPEIVKIVGRRLVVASEPPKGARLGEDMVKKISGGTKMSARRLFEGMFEFYPTFKLWIDCNMKPQIRGQDEGIWRRVLLVPWEVYLAPEERDMTLGDTLKREEAPGILNWILRGVQEWRAQGLAPPGEVTIATDTYRLESDPIGEFLLLCVEEKAGEKITRDRLYDCYRRYCGVNGLQPVTGNSFGRTLSDKGLKRDKQGITVYLDVSLTEAGEKLFEAKHKTPDESTIPGDHTAAPIDPD